MSTITVTPTFSGPTHVRPTVARPAVARPAAARAAAARPGGQLRLTTRGRVVLTTLALAMLLGLSVFFGNNSVATRDAGRPVPTETIVVGSGQTLWDISSNIAAATGQRDVRDVMHEIERLNRLDSGMLLAGQRLRVPVTP